MREKIVPAVFLMLVLLIGFPSSAVNFSIFADDDDNEEHEFEGIITAIVKDVSFDLLLEDCTTVTIFTDDTSDLMLDFEVEVEVVLSNSSLVATEIEIEEEEDEEELEFEGIITAIVKDVSFDLLLEDCTTVTIFTDDTSGLILDFEVEVEVVLSNSSLVAIEIEVEDDGEEENDDKIEICHIPKGNPSNAHTISVGEPAGKAHLSHGDLEGACGYDLESTIDKWEEKYSKKLEKLEEKRAKLEQKQIELAQKYAEKLGKLESEYADKQSILTEKQTLKLERLSEKFEELEADYKQKSEKLLEKLNQKFNQLDERSQKLVEKFNSGEYFGESDITEDEIHEIVLRFDSLMGESFIDSSTSNFVVDITLEASSNISSGHQKFKVTGCQIIGDEVSYHCVFGKARTISLGTGNNNGLDIVAFLEDDNSEATSSLRAHVIPLDSSAIWLQEDTTEVTMNAKISLQWTLSGDGTLTNSINEDKDGDNEEN